MSKKKWKMNFIGQNQVGSDYSLFYDGRIRNRFFRRSDPDPIFFSKVGSGSATLPTGMDNFAETNTQTFPYSAHVLQNILIAFCLKQAENMARIKFLALFFFQISGGGQLLPKKIMGKFHLKTTLIQLPDLQCNAIRFKLTGSNPDYPVTGYPV